MKTTTKSSPPSLTVLGFDFGLRKFGVAVGQTITKTASPVQVLDVKDGELPEEELDRLLKAWHPDILIVGMPFNMDGTLSPLTARVEIFAAFLESYTHLPVHLVDERLSTRHARYELEALTEQTKTKHKKQRLDAFAACLIIETWLRDYAQSLRGNF